MKSEQRTFNNKQQLEQGAFNRNMPCNIIAEQMLLGHLLIDNEILGKINDFLVSDHFFDPLHKKIYSAVILLNEKAIVASPVTLKNHFEHDEIMKNRGGHEYLVELASLSATIINHYDYAKIIYDLALKRELIHVGEDIVNDAFSMDLERSAVDQLETAEQKLYNLSEGRSESNTNFIKLDASLKEAINKAHLAFQNKGRVSGVSTNFVDVDELLGGFQNSDLIILAGRPSMGKTALATNLALNCCKALLDNQKQNQEKTKKSIAFFSLEMSSEQIASRIISMISAVSTSKLRTGHLTEDEFKDIVQATKELQNLEFYIDETPSLSISALRTRARRLKRQNNLGMIFIDYLQLMRASSGTKDQNRVQEISEITQGLKAIAKELNVPVLALSQLSRAVEQREDKRPLLSDLRESGSIEQDADIVMFIYREDYYLYRKKPQEGTDLYEKWQHDMENVRNTTEVIVSKHRNGPIGTVKLHFDSQYTRFTNFYNEH
jgi:replicative DNA helicase